jgi:hypothetical protein
MVLLMALNPDVQNSGSLQRFFRIDRKGSVHAAFADITEPVPPIRTVILPGHAHFAL